MDRHSMLHEWVDVIRRRQTAEWCNWALQGIGRAVVFHVGEVSDLPVGKPEQWDVLRPPYPTTVLEFDFPEDDFRTIGLILCSEREDGQGFWIISAEKVKGGGWVTGSPLTGCRAADGSFDFSVPDHGTDHSLEVVRARWALAATVFNLLTCGNVQVVDHLAPEKLNAKRVVRGKSPLYSFKTLCLQVPNLRRDGAALGGAHAPPRLHLRRGHIRQLSDGRRVWVQSCVVGSGPGVVDKDYRLLARAGEA